MIVVKGAACVLREMGLDGDLDAVGLRFPASYVLCHDPSGEYLRPCDFYICRFIKTDIKEDRINENDVTTAERFYGNATPLADGLVDLPDGDWHRVCLVDQIGYQRRGDRGGSYKHEYAEGVPLYECKGKTRAWRLRHPADCVADERGFVKPLVPSSHRHTSHGDSPHMRKKPAKKKTAKKTRRSAAPKARKTRKSPVKRRAAAKRRPAATKRRATRRRPAARKRKDRRHETHRQEVAEKRAKRSRRKPRKTAARRRAAPKRRAARRSNPVGRRHHKGHKRHAFGRRRSNPTGAKQHMTGMGVTDLLIVGAAVVGGMFAADIVDRIVATRHGASTSKTGAFHGSEAALLITAPADGIRLGAQALLAIASVVGGSYLWKKGYKKAGEFACGMGVGAGSHAALQVWNDKAVPALFKVNATGDNFAARVFPDLQKDQLDALAKLASDKRNSTAGLPTQQRAPIQGTPRVTARPQTNAAGSAPDQALVNQLAAMKAEITRLKSEAVSSSPVAANASITPIKKSAFAQLAD